jgi:type I restriction enzyme S subunit
MHVNVPELRFPEFSDEWEEKKINELFEFFPTNSFSRANLNYESGKVKNIHYGDIHTKFSSNLDCELVEIPFINSDVELNKIKEESYCKNGDLVIADASEDYNDIGKAVELKNVNKNQVLAGLHTFLARDKSGLTVDGYKGYILLNEDIKLQIKKIATGISVLGISKTNLGELKIKIPSTIEQEKIASFLSKVDEKIGFLEKKQELWETYKKGIMQHIFSRELRFKDENGENFLDWEEKKIGYIFSERIEKGFDDLPLLSVTLKRGVIKRDEIEGKDNSSENKSNYKRVMPNDIPYNSMRMWQGASGVSLYEGIVSPAYTVLIPNAKIFSQYFGYYFKTKEAIYQFKKYSQGLTSDTWNLKFPLLSEIKIQYPSLPEQEKIANFLSEIDIKIFQIENKLEIIKKFKKGLLQQMFL